MQITDNCNLLPDLLRGPWRLQENPVASQLIRTKPVQTYTSITPQDTEHERNRQSQQQHSLINMTYLYTVYATHTLPEDPRDDTGNRWTDTR
jgi:hypothetical protein